MNKLSLILMIVMSCQQALSSIGEWDEFQALSDQVNPEIIGKVISPSNYEVSINSQNITSITVKLVRDEGRIETLETPDLEINCDQEMATARLDNKYFKIKNRDIFELQGKVICGKSNTWLFDASSSEGQVLAINNIAMKAVRTMAERGILSFWKKKITMKWPANGDYYSWNTVNITRGDYWDVVGHELGHAIYDQADIGSTDGGRHRIDECYSSALALSEGWASFFSAWLSIDLKDVDAKFEFLVKRRAPIRFENIPIDVCKGPTNEWRVTGFLWDIIDLAYDGENSEMSFTDFWKFTLDADFSNITKLAKSLRKQVDPILVNIIWENNFLTTLD